MILTKLSPLKVYHFPLIDSSPVQTFERICSNFSNFSNYSILVIKEILGPDNLDIWLFWVTTVHIRYKRDIFSIFSMLDDLVPCCT